jgi:hypothetical protein
MPNYGPDCAKCFGEDCQCCEVFQEHMADLRADQERDPFEDNDPAEDFDHYLDLDDSYNAGDDPDDTIDGYGETPLGEQLEGE